VKDAVLTATKDAQEPWIYGSPGGDSIALVPAAAKPVAPKPAAPSNAAGKNCFTFQGRDFCE